VGCDLLHWHVFEVVQREDSSLLHREISNGCDEIGVKFGIWRSRFPSTLDDLAPALSLHVPDGQSDRYPSNPSARPLIAGHLRPMQQQLDERLLSHVLCRGAVAGHHKDRPTDLRELGSEKLLIALIDPTHWTPLVADIILLPITGAGHPGSLPRSETFLGART